MRYTFTAAIIGMVLASGTVADECSERCTAAWEKCEKVPHPDYAACGDAYAKCLGFNPLQASKIVTPTACSKGPVLPEATKVVVTDPCAEKCNADFGACEKAQGAGNADCHTKYTGCLGYDPFTGSSFAVPTACKGAGVGPGPTGAVGPVVVAGGSSLEPALAMLAFGAVALF